jgi:hypothetical protein
VTLALPPEEAELEDVLDLELLDDAALEAALDDEDAALLLLAVELLEALEEALLLGIEHSLTPPETRVPVPKVASLHTKLPLSTR